MFVLFLFFHLHNCTIPKHMLLIPFIRFGAHKPTRFLAPFVIHYLSAVMVFEWACLVMIYQPLCTPWMHIIVMCDNKDILNLNLKFENFGTECHLKHISKPKFRIALSKLRASSHDLELERPKRDLNERLCISCHVIEYEEHIVTDCVNNREMRKSFFEKISLGEPEFANWTNQEFFFFLMFCDDPQKSTWFSRFLYHSFHTRKLRTLPRV